MKGKSFILLLTVIMLCMSVFSYAFAEDTDSTSADNIIKVTDKNVRFLGRTYKDTKKDAYYFNWTASGFEFKFEGTTAIAEFLTNPSKEPEKWAPQIYVFVDGKDEPSEGKIISIYSDKTTYVLAEDLPYGEHTIKIVKKTANITWGDPLTGVIGVKALNLPGGKLLDPPPSKDLKLEFFGDSITVGSAVDEENGREDGWRTYAAYAARKLDADMNVQAIPGMGLICSLFGDKFIEIPDDFPYTDRHNCPKQLWNHTKYQTDVAVINLGTNDGAGVGPGKKFSYQDYEDGYYKFIMEIKSKYPKCKVIGMIGAMGRQEMLPYIDNAVKRANEELGETFAYSMELSQYYPAPGADGHPNAEKHAEYGEQLVALINEIVDWDTIDEEMPVDEDFDEYPNETTKPETPEESPKETPVDESPAEEPTIADEETVTDTEEPPVTTSEDTEDTDTEVPNTNDNGIWFFTASILFAAALIALTRCGFNIVADRIKK